ncbi:TPA: hypothetical protein JBB31_04030 [Legionella pneumophila subsp. pneumophila]|nr:hypothetical protein [Legionella pneumophila subsp. pneumophila]
MIIRFFLNILSYMPLIFLNGISSAATFSITPASFAILPTSISEGQSAMAYYIVKNNTASLQKNINARYLPPNVEQVVNNYVLKNTCGSSFDLSAKGTIPHNDKEPYDWCFLQLKITGAVDSGDPNSEHHLTICQGQLNCSQVELKEQELNVIQGVPNSLARLAVVMEHFEKPAKLIKSIVYSSTDGGIGWIPHEITGSTGYVRSMTCKGDKGQFCIIVGDAYGKGTNGDTTTFLAYTSKDAGITWTKHILGIHGGASGLSDVSCNGSNGEYCVAVGGFTPISNRGRMAPIVYTTSDNGASWTANYPKTFDSLVGARISAVSCSGNSGQNCTAVGLYYSGYENNINTTTFLSYTSSDGGNNWVPHVLEKHAGISELKSVKCNDYDGKTCIAVGTLNSGPTEMKPVIYKTTNGGADWTNSNPNEGSDGTLNAISCDKYNQDCKAVGSVLYPSGKNNKVSYPIIYQSIDGGNSWIAKKFGGCTNNICAKAFKAISCSDEGKYCTAIGSAHDKTQIISIVYLSFDGGITWYPRFNSSFSNYNDLIHSIESIGILASAFD